MGFDQGTELPIRSQTLHGKIGRLVWRLEADGVEQDLEAGRYFNEIRFTLRVSG